MFSLHGQTALVTGGTRGIGQAMALALAEAGADIILVQRDESKQETKLLIEQQFKRRVFIFCADLSSGGATEEIIPRIVSAGHRIHILLNCAGIQRRHPSHTFPTADWNEVRAGVDSLSECHILSSFFPSSISYRRSSQTNTDSYRCSR